MELTVEKVGDVVVAPVPLETLEAANAHDFKRQLLASVEGARKVVLDMGKVQFIDSMGIAVVLECLRELASHEGDLKLCSLTRRVRALFELTRMHRVAEIYNDREEAVKAFSS